MYSVSCAGRSRAQVTVIRGHDVTLQFTFNITITNSSHFAVYVEGNIKKAEHCPWKGCSRESGFDIYSANSSVFYQITNLTQGHSGTYNAILFPQSEPPKKSNKVHLIVQEEKSNNTGKHDMFNKMRNIIFLFPCKKSFSTYLLQKYPTE